MITLKGLCEKCKKIISKSQGVKGRIGGINSGATRRKIRDENLKRIKNKIWSQR